MVDRGTNSCGRIAAVLDDRRAMSLPPFPRALSRIPRRSVVTERARVIAGFDDSEDTFTHSGHKLRAGNAWVHLSAWHRQDAAVADRPQHMTERSGFFARLFRTARFRAWREADAAQYVVIRQATEALEHAIMLADDANK